MGPLLLLLLLAPVAEVPVFLLDNPSTLQPSLWQLPPSPVHVLSLIWMGMSWATSNTCHHAPLPFPSLPSPPPTNTNTTTSSSSTSLTISLFSLSSPSRSVLCDLLESGRHVITLLDTKDSRQPVFLEEEEEREQGKQSDTAVSSAYQDILF
ncbi:hypothetical protein D9C73_022582 [Xyrichtys novacula]|uniref:Uncharacterized protein n=1 Tax=Xyrichtys novacula TaxID=13765 RepID=A0AAV1HCL3_XYRNO|nr:hypothetical protein D9C73_022582 [Xyrichtys novacula]